jgi:hypothetical protein
LIQYVDVQMDSSAASGSINARFKQIGVQLNERGRSLGTEKSIRVVGWWDFQLLIGGRTVAIEYRWAEGRPERFAEIAAEFVRLKVDVIVTLGGAVLAARQATSVIPIVFAAAGNPVATGFPRYLHYLLPQMKNSLVRIEPR